MQTDPPWDDLRLLLALHRHRSFLGAAKALGVATSTISRRMDALERTLGRVIVHRSSAGTFVEPSALELVGLAEQMDLGLRATRRDQGDGESALVGTVRISLPEGGARPVMQRLTDLRRRHPGLELEILSEARLVNLARREADVGLRGSKSASPSVVHRSVGRVTFGLYAAPSYVERRLRGVRLTPEDFARHDFLGHDDPKTTQTGWLRERGATRFVIRSNSDLVLLDAAACGEGIALVADSSARGVPGLLRLEVDAPFPSLPVYVAYQRDLRKIPRVRAVVEAMAAAISEAAL